MGIGYIATNSAETWAVDLKTGEKLLGFESRGGAVDARPRREPRVCDPRDAQQARAAAEQRAPRDAR
jgi:hypothetical protein